MEDFISMIVKIEFLLELKGWVMWLITIILLSYMILYLGFVKKQELTVFQYIFVLFAPALFGVLISIIPAFMYLMKHSYEINYIYIAWFMILVSLFTMYIYPKNILRKVNHK